MRFQTFDYGLFLVVIFIVYWFLPRRLQNLLLLGASYLFYSYVDQWVGLLLVGYTLVTYFAARKIEVNKRHARLYLAMACTSSLGVLGIFKYASFFVESFISVLEGVGLAGSGSTLRILLPAGISFYTFQSIGYVIDVYMGRTHARRNFLDVALFISFFPQLVSGPIERAKHLLPQIENKRKFSVNQTSEGLSLIVWGLFKKLVIADNVGMIVDTIFSTSSPGAAMLWVGTFAFGVQILADFSGYTDIARGSARLLGIHLSANFRHPWLSSSPRDFWRRWHISLSSWLRDYVYIPLGGNRRGNYRTVGSILITFVLAGIWHGAGWNFILWGLFHAGLIMIWHSTNLGTFRLGTIVSTSLTFMTIGISWILFRENDLTYITSNLMAFTGNIRLAAFFAITTLIYSFPIWLHALASRSYIGTILQEHDPGPTSAQTTITLMCFIGILLVGANNGSEFIYFRF